MATGEHAFAAAARSCALFLLLLLLAASVPAAQSSRKSELTGNYQSTSTRATEGPHKAHSSHAAAVSNSEIGANEILIDVEARPVDDACFEVCCWQGDPRCPYPYCNYNQGPCEGDNRLIN